MINIEITNQANERIRIYKKENKLKNKSVAVMTALDKAELYDKILNLAKTDNPET
jgi:hypothetical protein